VVWSSSDGSTVPVGQTSGIVTAADIGSATITAAAGSCSACSGSTTVTVVLTGVTSITVSPSSQGVTINSSTPAYFTATASPGGDITQFATWNVFDQSGTDQTANFTLSYQGGTGFGEGFVPTSSATVGTYTVQASYPGTTAVGKATLNVN